MPNAKIRNLYAVVLVLGAILASSCSRAEKVQAGVAPPTDDQTVAVAKAAADSLSRNLVLTAEFRPYQEVDVMAKVAGYIKEINVDVGDHVKQNQLLATLEVPEMADDLRRAQASVERSQADVQHAKDEVQRTVAARDIARLSFDRLNEV